MLRIHSARANLSVHIAIHRISEMFAGDRAGAMEHGGRMRTNPLVRRSTRWSSKAAILTLLYDRYLRSLCSRITQSGHFSTSAAGAANQKKHVTHDGVVSVVLSAGRRWASTNRLLNFATEAIKQFRDGGR
jgi:hypothetical protein